MQNRTTMQNIEVFPRHDPETPGLMLVLMRVIQVDAIHWRYIKATCGTPLAELQRQAEQWALERWPGPTQYRLALMEN
jgi:hypothetical protein